MPAGNALVVKVAVPAASVPVPSTVAPVLNVIVSPFGTLPPVEATVAVNVTACPNVDGFEPDCKVVVVAVPVVVTAVSVKVPEA